MIERERKGVGREELNRMGIGRKGGEKKVGYLAILLVHILKIKERRRVT